MAHKAADGRAGTADGRAGTARHRQSGGCGADVPRAAEGDLRVVLEHHDGVLHGERVEVQVDVMYDVCVDIATPSMYSTFF